MDIVKPKALRRGDRIAVVSPSGPLPESDDNLERGLARLRRWGLEPVVMPHARDRQGFLAGADEDRAADLQAALDDPEIRAIFCARGGYGAMRILDRLDLRRLAEDPKPILGYSDITALLAATFGQAGVIGFHGPMVATAPAFAIGDACLRLQRELVTGTDAPARLPRDERGSAHVMVEGQASGRLVGGNLSLVCALVGTPWEIDVTDRIVFLEDVDEQPYRVDRMLTQLLLGKFFARAAAVVLGDFHVSDTPLASEHQGITRVLYDRLGDSKIPVAFGFPFGHRPRSWTLPYGARARLDARDERAVPRLELLEPAVR
jgi:muramoyltetrapeptide carboxypeptidase